MCQKVAAFGLDVAFAAGAEILTSSPSVGGVKDSYKQPAVTAAVKSG